VAVPSPIDHSEIGPRDGVKGDAGVGRPPKTGKGATSFVLINWPRIVCFFCSSGWGGGTGRHTPQNFLTQRNNQHRARLRNPNQKTGLNLRRSSAGSRHATKTANGRCMAIRCESDKKHTEAVARVPQPTDQKTKKNSARFCGPPPICDPRRGWLVDECFIAHCILLSVRLL